MSHMLAQRSPQLVSLASFDAGALLYYSPRRRPTTCSATSRRVQRTAAHVDEVLRRVEQAGPLSHYDLEGRLQSLGNIRKQSLDSIDSSSSSETDTSDSEAETKLNSRRRRGALPPDTAARLHTPVATISVCMGKACQKRGAARVLQELQASTVDMPVVCGTCKCLDQCKRGPAVRVELATGKTSTYVGMNGPTSAAQVATAVKAEAFIHPQT
jgi:hypothetical protein